MPHPIAFLNGQFIPQDQLHITPQDVGFMWGVTIAEQLRTFQGELFMLDEHLKRLTTGLQTIGVSVAMNDIASAAGEVVRRNFPLLNPKNDLGLTIFVTPGMSRTYQPSGIPIPTVGIHSYPLPFELWADKYQSGQSCELSTIQQVAATSWPRGIKARSRLHYYLADKDARSRDTNSRAILLDNDGNVNEASTANVVVHFPGEGLVSPPRKDVLLGVSLQYLEALCREHQERFSYRPISAEELADADEILLTSTPFCLLPVSRIGSRTLKSRRQFDQWMDRWSKSVGVDIIAQASTATDNG